MGWNSRARRRVLCADAEANLCGAIAKHSMSDVRFELVQVLMGKRETHAVSSEFTHRVGEGENREALKLVHIGGKRPALGRLLGAGERGRSSVETIRLPPLEPCSAGTARQSLAPFCSAIIACGLVGHLAERPYLR